MPARSNPHKSRKPAAAARHAQLTREVARNDMALGLTSLFRPLPDGAVRQEVVIEQEFAGVSLRFRGIAMNAFEQGVFLAVLAIALRGGEQATAQQANLLPALPHQDAGGRNHRENIAAQAWTLEVTTNLAELCGVAGLPRKPGSETIHAIRVAFERLSSVVVSATTKDNRWGLTHLIGGGLGSGGQVTVRLNPRAARALLDTKSGSYAQVEMPVYRALRGPVPRILYAWLAAWFSGQSGVRQIGMDRLEMHCFGAIAKDRKTRSRRRKQMIGALAQIEQATGGRCAASVESGIAQITRSMGHEDDHVGKLRPARDADTPSARHVPSENAPVQDAAQAAADSAAR